MAAKADVVVVGAGMAGLSCAGSLQKRGVGVCVVEARERTGGRVWSIRDFGPVPVEAGAEFVHGDRAATWPVIRRAGLHNRPCPVFRHAMFRLGERTAWLPLHLLHPSVWPSFDILRRLRRAREDLPAAEILRRAGYRGRARELAEMTVTAHLPGSAEEIGVRGLVGDGVLHLETGTNHRIAEGYDALSTYLARGIPVRTGFTVACIHWSAEGVAVESTRGDAIEGRAGVVTLPVGVLQSGRISFRPPLPPDKTSAIFGIRSGPVVKLLLRFRQRFWPRWLAILGCPTGPVTLYWPVDYGAPDPAPLLTAYATGPRAALLGAVSEDEAVGLACRDLAAAFRRRVGERDLLDARRIDWAADPLACGGYTFLPPGAGDARERLAAPTTGALFWAGSATHRVPVAATVEAAYLSGLRAAEEAARRLGC